MIETNTLWLMDRDRLEAMATVVGRMGWPTAPQIEEFRQAQAAQVRRVSGKVGIIPVHGVVEQRLSGWSFLMGGTSTENVGAALDYFMTDKSIGAVLLHVDSPGGTSYGVEELSDQIYAARQVKPVYAIADSMAASAAYWIASAASNLSITPGGDVGSVGVFILHAEQSAALEKEGVKVNIIRAGKYKAETNPYEPLTQGGRDHLQEMVDETYGKFTKSLARNRGVPVADVRSQFGQGRIVGADKALASKMVDRVLSLGSLLGTLTGGNVGAVREIGVDMMRLRHEHRKRMETC